MRWNATDDSLTLDVTDVAITAKDLIPTKRNVVSVVGWFYDPLGVLSPVVIQFKILFQQLSESRVEWDQPISGELLSKWQSLVSMLESGPQILIPRCFLYGVAEEVESYKIYGFCDASKGAYATVIYLVIKASASSHVKFVASKHVSLPLVDQLSRD